MGQAFKKHPKLVFAVSTVWDGLPKNIPNRFLLCPLYRVQFTWLDSSYWWFILPGRPFHLVDCLPWEFLGPQEVIDPKWLPPMRVFGSTGGHWSKVIASCKIFLIHGRIFHRIDLLPWEFFDPQEVIEPKWSPPMRVFGPTGGFFFKITSSCIDFPIFRLLLLRKTALFFTFSVSEKETKKKKSDVQKHIWSWL